MLPSDMTKNLDDFYSYCLFSRSKNTAEAYYTDIKSFLSYTMGLGLKRIASVKQSHVMRYLTLKKSESAASSTQRALVAIRAFYKYLCRFNIVLTDISKDIESMHVPCTPIQVLTPGEVRRVIEYMDEVERDSWKVKRDRAIIETLYGSGLRVGELCALDIQHYQPPRLQIPKAKGNKTYTVPITSSCIRAVDLYLDEVRRREDGPLFLSQVWGRMNSKMVANVVHKYFGKEITPHKLRHACATHLLQNGADVAMIQKLLGHANISSTQKYLHLTIDSISEMFTKFHPMEA